MPKTVEDRMRDKYEADGGRNAEAVPWALIIQAIMALLGGCKSPAVIKRWAKRHPDAAAEAIENALKETGYFSSLKDRTTASDAAYDVLLKMSNEEIRQYLR